MFIEVRISYGSPRQDFHWSNLFPRVVTCDNRAFFFLFFFMYGNQFHMVIIIGNSLMAATRIPSRDRNLHANFILGLACGIFPLKVPSFLFFVLG